MFDINLTHEQQQKAVEQIQELMAKGISSGEAIQIVAKALREIHKNDKKLQIIKFFVIYLSFLNIARCITVQNI